MTWQLGSKPGVVDAVDRYGRPMEVPLPEHKSLFPPTCPPCTGNCLQGRACTQREERAVPHGFQIWVGSVLGIVLIFVGWVLGELVADLMDWWE